MPIFFRLMERPKSRACSEDGIPDNLPIFFRESNEICIVSIEKLSKKCPTCLRFCVAVCEIKDFTCDSESKVAANISLGKCTRKLQ